MKNKVKITGIFLTTFIGLLILFVLAVNTGSLRVSTGQLVRGLFVEYDDSVAMIYQLRFPRIFIAMLAGAGMAVSGVLFQAVLKNSLADTGISGIAGGASCFATLITIFFPTLIFFIPLFAFIGGSFAFILVYCISWQGGLSPVRIILVGIAVNAAFEGIVRALNYMSGQNVSGVASIVEGNIAFREWKDVRMLAIVVLIGLIGGYVVAKRCNLLSLEEKTIRGLGIRVNVVRLYISFFAVLLACICTSITGIIGFLGLIVPHLGRILVGKDHKVLIPYSAILGAFVYLGADTLGRFMAYPYEIPATVIMAIIGGPCFVILLKRRQIS